MYAKTHKFIEKYFFINTIDKIYAVIIQQYSKFAYIQKAYMNILIVGAGGREHTLAWKLKQSPLCNELFIAPGNAGTALCGTNLPIETSDFSGLRNAVKENNIELIIVGPEEPLVNGITDYFNMNEDTKHVNIIGPSKNASQLEGSKAFAKSFMEHHKIPTAKYTGFTIENYKEGVEYIRQHALPIVLKADGLAAGKGVLICQSHIEALAEFELMIMRSKFGEAGKKVIIEDFLQGIEISVFALTDGQHYILLPEAKDYKRVGDGDKGLNTGGMGAVSPIPFFEGSLKEKVERTIIEPTIVGLKKDDLDYKGFIFFGLMISNNEPYVIEYNCRLGDPETEVVLPRLKNDLVEIFSAVANGRLNEIKVDIDERSAATIVAVSGGYPGEYTKGRIITGLDGDPVQDSMVFHSGTIQDKDKVVTNGGRVLAVTAFGTNIREASEVGLYMMEQLYFEDMNFRNDIGYEFV
jgi:phosphoribosylamine--glycine ligase